MTADEAKRIQEICNSADGQCYHCAGSLCAELIKAFPEHEATFTAAYQSEWKDEDPRRFM